MFRYFALHGCFVIGLWMVAPSAVNGECQIPKEFHDGRIIYEKGGDEYLKIAPDNYLLKFECFIGFTLFGSDAIFCAGGIWSHDIPSCIALSKYCEDPPRIPHGVAKGEKMSEYFLSYDEIEIICEPGYTYNRNSPFIMCEEDGTWEDEFGECTEIVCDPPEHLECGTIPELSSTNFTVFPYGFKLTYICNHEFRLIGSIWRFCGQRGWTGKTPYCELTACRNPGVPEHGRRIGNSFQIGDKVVFTCNSGYTLLGSFERYCMPNGQWSGQLTSCDEPGNYCPDPGIPINGMKNSSNYDEDSTIGFRCKHDYRLIGSEVRKCLPNRTWSGVEAKCIGTYDFQNSGKMNDILKSAVEEKAEEQESKMRKFREAILSNCTANASCLTGRLLDVDYPERYILYFAFDASGCVGESNFKKSVDFAKALVRRVGISKHGVRAGALTFNYNAQIWFTPLEFTTTDDVLNAMDGLQYTGGGTAASFALKLMREDMIPITRMHLGAKNEKSIIIILASGKANMGESSLVEAEILKEAGFQIYCIGITGSSIASLEKLASHPKEEHVFLLNNYTDFSDIVQVITNKTRDYYKCGRGPSMQTERGRIVGGSRTAEYWPWMAAIYFIYSPTDVEAELKCGGSIVSPNYVLTAAHCFFKHEKGEMIPWNEEEIYVKLGLKNVKQQINIQKFEVKKLHIHHNFIVGPYGIQNYDYDIALLRLKRPIEYNRYIRPICLPPENLPPESTFYKDGEWAFVTGWGYDRKQELNREIDAKTIDYLKELKVPIQSRDTCMQSLVDKRMRQDIFTDRMFCAGDGKGNDACSGDSGGPVMQYQVDIDGNIHWTQIGIVSWGIGCGLQNMYGFYTHVHKLRSWIMETLEAKDNE